MDVLSKVLFPVPNSLEQGEYRLWWHRDHVGMVEVWDEHFGWIALLDGPHTERLRRCFARDQVQLWRSEGAVKMRLKRRV